MTKEKWKYILIGFLAALALVVSLGAAGTGAKGRYSIACTRTTAFVLNTQTGEVKVAWAEANGSQLNKPFAEMKARP
jgi:hypothetical protein